jgi:hypothetical protein
MSSPAFVVVCVIDDSHFGWSEVESQCSFMLFAGKWMKLKNFILNKVSQA